MSDDDSQESELHAIYRRLNDRFYTADPVAYFHTRWHAALMLLAGRPAELLAMLRDGTTYQHVQAQVPGDDPNAGGHPRLRSD